MSFSACWSGPANDISGGPTPGLGKGHSPFRVVNATGREVAWVNRLIRSTSVVWLILRYAHDLLHFLRWWTGVNQTDAIAEGTLNKSTLLDYIRFQANQDPKPAADSINRRVGTAERAFAKTTPGAESAAA